MSEVEDRLGGEPTAFQQGLIEFYEAVNADGGDAGVSAFCDVADKLMEGGFSLAQIVSWARCEVYEQSDVKSKLFMWGDDAVMCGSHRLDLDGRYWHEDDEKPRHAFDVGLKVTAIEGMTLEALDSWVRSGLEFGLDEDDYDPRLAAVTLFKDLGLTEDENAAVDDSNQQP